MNAIGAIITVLYMFFAVSVIISFAWNLLQIPFAIIGRWAVILCHVPYFYYLSVSLALSVKANVIHFSTSPIPLLIVGTLFFFFVAAIPGSKGALAASLENPQPIIHFVFPLLFSVLVWYEYYFDLYFCIRPVLWVFSVLDFLLKNPFLGGLLRGLFVMFSLFVVVKMAISLIIFARNSFRKKVI